MSKRTTKTSKPSILFLFPFGFYAFECALLSAPVYPPLFPCCFSSFPVSYCSVDLSFGSLLLVRASVCSFTGVPQFVQKFSFSSIFAPHSTQYFIVPPLCVI